MSSGQQPWQHILIISLLLIAIFQTIRFTPKIQNLATELDNIFTRVDYMRSQCKKYDLGRDLNQTSYETLQNYPFEVRDMVRFMNLTDNYIIMCFPPKSGTTHWQQAMVAAKTNHTMDWAVEHFSKKFDYDKIDRFEYLFNNKYSQDEPYTENQISDFASLLFESTNFKFFNVRHPLARLHSAWHDKFCNWNDSHHDSSVRKVFRGYDNAMRKYETDIDEKIPGQVVSFESFIKYVVTEGNRPGDVKNGVTKRNKHWVPIMDLCRPCEIPYQAITKIENAEDDSKVLFKKLKIEKIGEFPKAYTTFCGNYFVYQIYRIVSLLLTIYAFFALKISCSKVHFSHSMMMKI